MLICKAHPFVLLRIRINLNVGIDLLRDEHFFVIEPLVGSLEDSYEAFSRAVELRKVRYRPDEACFMILVDRFDSFGEIVIDAVAKESDLAAVVLYFR